MRRFKRPRCINSMNAVWKKFIKYADDKEELDVAADVIHRLEKEFYYVCPPKPKTLEEINSKWHSVLKGLSEEKHIRHLSQIFNFALDDLGDYFGTEGQNDPRGDRRD